MDNVALICIDLLTLDFQNSTTIPVSNNQLDVIPVISNDEP
jgi:hypothetical protein